MASHLHLHLHLLLLLPLLFLLAASTGYRADLERHDAELDHPQPAASFRTELKAGFRAELTHPYASSSVSVHDMWRRSARASNARVARLHARQAGNMSALVPLARLSDEGYTVTVGIGTPPQRRTLVLDTASDLTWTQCKHFNGTTKQREPLFDPSNSSSFAFLPCTSHLCTEDNPGSKRCSKSNNTCQYDYGYVGVETVGVLATETFTFGAKEQLSVTMGFGCGALTDGTLLGASGIFGMSPSALSMVSQLTIPKFSYCLTPYAERRSSPLFLGAMADVGRYKTTGAIQSVPILKNPAMSTYYYYVPLVGLSLGTRRLDVPESTFAMQPRGIGGTVVDCGSTIAHFAEPGFKAVKEAVLETLGLPLANKTVEDYEVCFVLPSGVSMHAVHTPPLVLHFDGGVDMVLPRDNYFQEPRPGLMCLAVASGVAGVSVIGNVQQQNFHVLYDVQDSKFVFAPTSCDEI